LSDLISKGFSDMGFVRSIYIVYDISDLISSLEVSIYV